MEIKALEGLDGEVTLYTKGHRDPKEFLVAATAFAETEYGLDEFSWDAPTLVQHAFARKVPSSFYRISEFDFIVDLDARKGRGAFPVTYYETWW